MARHHDASAGDAPRGVQHDLATMHDKHHSPPLRDGPADQGGGCRGFAKSGRRDQQDATVMAVGRSHTGDGLLLVRSEDNVVHRLRSPRRK